MHLFLHFLWYNQWQGLWKTQGRTLQKMNPLNEISILSKISAPQPLIQSDGLQICSLCVKKTTNWIPTTTIRIFPRFHILNVMEHTKALHKERVLNKLVRKVHNCVRWHSYTQVMKNSLFGFIDLSLLALAAEWSSRTEQKFLSTTESWVCRTVPKASSTAQSISGLIDTEAKFNRLFLAILNRRSGEDCQQREIGRDEMQKPEPANCSRR